MGGVGGHGAGGKVGAVSAGGGGKFHVVEVCGVCHHELAAQEFGVQDSFHGAAMLHEGGN